MVKKKSGPSLQQLLNRPWCYYCDRDFDDLKVLISHQRAKHFKCDKCSRRLNTAGGLVIHGQQVHKEVVNAVFNALPGRQDPHIEIFGMEGVPPQALAAHRQHILAEAGHDLQQSSGMKRSGGGGGGSGGAPKRVKSVDPKQIQNQLAAFRAKKKHNDDENEPRHQNEQFSQQYSIPCVPLVKTVPPPSSLPPKPKTTFQSTGDYYLSKAYLKAMIRPTTLSHAITGPIPKSIASAIPVPIVNTDATTPHDYNSLH